MTRCEYDVIFVVNEDPGTATASPEDKVAKVISSAPKLTLRWLGIAGARLGFYKPRPVRGGRIDNSKALVVRGRLDNETACVGEAGILSGLRARLECSLEHCPIIVCEFLVAVEGESFIDFSCANIGIEVTGSYRVAFASRAGNASGVGKHHGDAS